MIYVSQAVYYRYKNECAIAKLELEKFESLIKENALNKLSRKEQKVLGLI